MSTRQPKVAVITPYYKEELELLEQCHHSVQNQTYPCLHVMVADGVARKELENWDIHHIALPQSHNDIGSTPRLIGSVHAIGLGLDAVAILDADNWYEPEHIEELVSAMVQRGAAFASSGRMLWSLDGYAMGSCPLTNPKNFIDTNCMLFGRAAFHLLHHWVLMPDYGHLIGDRIVYHYVRRSGLPRVHVPDPTVNYRCGKPGLYQQLGEPVPASVPARPDYESSLKKWIADGNPSLT
jgi:glycosyltransferase involved in cell wall biosynthesis